MRIRRRVASELPIIRRTNKFLSTDYTHISEDLEVRFRTTLGLLVLLVNKICEVIPHTHWVTGIWVQRASVFFPKRCIRDSKNMIEVGLVFDQVWNPSGEPASEEPFACSCALFAFCDYQGVCTHIKQYWDSSIPEIFQE